MIADHIGAWPTQCYFNCRRAIQKLDDYAQASYVEGFAASQWGCFEHGWIVRDGQIIELTLDLDLDVAYFAGLEFKGRAGIAEFLATPLGRGCKRTAFFTAFGMFGGESASFALARADAMKHFITGGA